MSRRRALVLTAAAAVTAVVLLQARSSGLLVPGLGLDRGGAQGLDAPLLGLIGRGAQDRREEGRAGLPIGGPVTPAATAAPLPTARTAQAAGAPQAQAHVEATQRPLLPGQPRQITWGGCCHGAWWAEDSGSLRFIDRPDKTLGAAIYAAPLWPPGSPPVVADDEMLLATGAPRLVVRPVEDHSVVEDVVSGDRWPLPTGGNPVRLSPDGSRAVWWEAQGGWAHNNTLVKVYGSDVYGFDERELGGLWGTRVVGFLPDNRRVLVVGRPVRDRTVFMLATLDVDSGSMQELSRGNWLTDATLSHGGSWVAYMTSLDRADPDANGVWVVPTSGGTPEKLDFVGAYRWRDDRRLAYIPMELGAPHHSVWQVDVETGQTEPLIGPEGMPLKVAGNEWSISPDGQTLAFVNQDDRNLWVVDLPP